MTKKKPKSGNDKRTTRGKNIRYIRGVAGDLWARFQARARRQEKTAGELMTEILERYLGPDKD